MAENVITLSDDLRDLAFAERSLGRPLSLEQAAIFLESIRAADRAVRKATERRRGGPALARRPPPARRPAKAGAA